MLVFHLATKGPSLFSNQRLKIEVFWPKVVFVFEVLFMKLGRIGA